METSGSSMLMLMPNEVEFVSLLIKAGMRMNELRVENVLLGLAPGAAATENGYALANENATTLQLKLEQLVLYDPALIAASKAALQATIGAYSTYPSNLKHIFHVKALHLG